MGKYYEQTGIKSDVSCISSKVKTITGACLIVYLCFCVFAIRLYAFVARNAFFFLLAQCLVQNMLLVNGTPQFPCNTNNELAERRMV